jgi:hypothetical protein
MIIGRSAARTSRRNVDERSKTMCRQKLRNEVPKAGNPLYLAVLIGRIFCNFLPIVDDLLCDDKAL